MADKAPTRLVEGPLCSICKGGLDITEVKMSEGAKVTYSHRDTDQEGKHMVTPVYKVVRP